MSKRAAALAANNVLSSGLSRFAKTSKKKLNSRPDSQIDETSTETNVKSVANDTNVTESTKSSSPEPKRGGKKRPIKIQIEELADNNDNIKKDKWLPSNWEIVLDNIRTMRKLTEAPVDTMGCDMCKDVEQSPKVQRFHTLISLMLSSQTKDQVTFAAMQRLKEHGLTVDSVLEMSDETLGKLIYPVGFWKSKVKYIKKTTQILKDKYDCDIPDTIEKLCELPGVGPKMAHLAMNCGWGVVTGIGVDTHVHRISNWIGWVKKTTKTPEETRVALESWLPKELWSEVNHLLVGFGQTICSPVKPKCQECLNFDICPYPKSNKKKK